MGVMEDTKELNMGTRFNQAVVRDPVSSITHLAFFQGIQGIGVIGAFEYQGVRIFCAARTPALSRSPENIQPSNDEPCLPLVVVFAVLMASAKTSRVSGGATRGRRLTRPGLRAGPLFTRACTLLMSPTIASATTGKAFGVRVGV